MFYRYREILAWLLQTIVLSLTKMAFTTLCHLLGTLNSYFSVPCGPASRSKGSKWANTAWVAGFPGSLPCLLCVSGSSQHHSNRRWVQMSSLPRPHNQHRGHRRVHMRASLRPHWYPCIIVQICSRLYIRWKQNHWKCGLCLLLHHSLALSFLNWR